MPQVSYGELDWMTEQLAIKLRHLGVKNNVVVGILMERCLEYVISYIAILRAGLHIMQHVRCSSQGKEKNTFCGDHACLSVCLSLSVTLYQ
jgi:acyl-CoA synthetase (AMP-forming)/AMP-acid ligase II